MPSVPPVTLPELPAVAGVPGLTEGVPVVGVVVVVPVCVPVVVPVWVPTPVLVLPGCVVVAVLGEVVLVPMPGLGVTVPVV
ncbi:MAG TPA: hypothetical protein VFR84_10795 [Candidatus Angelobacter sp.]|nr:hypothetical protein [Candidatus Angelobacter sp.]